MGDICAEICASFCAVCCLCCSSSLSTWCLQRGGHRGDDEYVGSSHSGCCTSLFKRRFDDDDFAREEERIQAEAARKAREQQENAENGDGTSQQQPLPKDNMTVPPRSEGHERSPSERSEHNNQQDK
ncbi:hypothetical protein C8Q75DRAFT_803610 [Abortiporus biennis]|nr:hypothetical protein C8Q75DRAFT_803610 [Abortiporus biennis]